MGADSNEAMFSLGELVQHKRFGYRGAIFGVDAVFSLTDEWYEEVARSRPPKEKPWYHVLVDGAAHTTYVAERHLQRSEDRSQLSHPLLGRYFESYDGMRYRLRGMH